MMIAKTRIIAFLNMRMNYYQLQTDPSQACTICGTFRGVGYKLFTFS